MNKNIVEWAKIIIEGIIICYIAVISLQILTPKGIIGVNFDNNDQNEVCISKITEGMPAAQAGLKLNDCIVSIDNNNISSNNPNYVASKIKGKPNTYVNIEIRRNNQIIKYEIKRIKRKIDWLFFLKK